MATQDTAETIQSRSPLDEASDTEEIKSESVILLAPKIDKTSDRDRTRIEKDVEGGIQPQDKGSNESPRKDLQDEKSATPGSREQKRKWIIIGFTLALLVCVVVGLATVFSFRRKDGTKNASADAIISLPTQTPTISTEPTMTSMPTSPKPTLSPTVSPSSEPSKEPTPSPSASPTVSPSDKPTVSPEPSDAPSAAPTKNFVSMLEEFFFGRYAVEFRGEGPSVLATEWLAREAVDTGILNFDTKLVQRFALLTMALTMQNANSLQDISMNAKLLVDECAWKGIRCDDQGNVEEIDWSHENAAGRIAPEVRLLASTLKRLDLSNNQLVGTIPEEIYSLTNMQQLYLFKNNLTGTISSKIGELDLITHFHLSHNNLSGRIPQELKSDNSGIRPLEYFNVYSNQLTGRLPESLRLRDMIYFDVGRNELTGTLPQDIGEKFVSLRHLHLDHNNFRGTLPRSFNTIGNGRLESFSIDHNKLTGTLPGPRELYNKLVQYTFHSNQFSGMEAETCRLEIPYGETVELRGDCNVCRCDGFFDICKLQCSSV